MDDFEELDFTPMPNAWAHRPLKPALRGYGGNYVHSWEPPSEFASRVGRTVMIHVQHGNFDFAHHVLDRAELDAKELRTERDEPAPDDFAELAAATSILNIGLDERLAAALHNAGYDFVSDVLVAHDDELRSITKRGGGSISQVRTAVKEAGFEWPPPPEPTPTTAP